MSSNYPYGLDPNYGASYLPPGAAPPPQQQQPHPQSQPGMGGPEDGKGKEDGGKGKEPTSPADSVKVGYEDGDVEEQSVL